MTPPAPYYDDGQVTIYHGDCRDVLPSVVAHFVLTDPPYGISWDTDYAGRGMGKATASNTYVPVHGDDEPFDPEPLLRFPRVVLFGANHYADRLPPSPGWLVWDKSGRGRHVSDLSDAELAWSNVTGGVRVFSHLWKGMLKDSERTQRRVHPTQKPVALMSWVIGNWAHPGDVIFDPFLGSGPVVEAAKAHGHKVIGIEIEERYCEIAAKRCAQEVLPL